MLLERGARVGVDDRATTAVIVQPCFFPWRGQLDLLSRADVCVYLDTVQYVRRSWCNRNRIMTRSGPRWITVPVRAKGNYHASIREMQICRDERWPESLLATIRHAYSRCRYFDSYYESLSEMLSRDWKRIADLSEASIDWAMEQLSMSTRRCRASDLRVSVRDPIRRLVELCGQVGANRYLSGPSAKAYLTDSGPFTTAGIEVEWMAYPRYPEYPQRIPCKEVPLSILDLLFNVGPEARNFIWN